MKKIILLLMFSFFLSGIKLSAQIENARMPGIYLELHTVPFFFVPVPIEIQLGYEHFFKNEFPGASVKAGISWVFRLDEKGIGFPVRFSYAVGSGRHIFEPGIGLMPGYYTKSSRDGNRLFELKKWSMVMVPELMYRYQSRPQGFFFKGGIAAWTPPLFEINVKNDFVDDGKYDGPFLRVLPTFGLGKNF